MGKDEVSIPSGVSLDAEVNHDTDRTGHPRQPRTLLGRPVQAVAGFRNVR